MFAHLPNNHSEQNTPDTKLFINKIFIKNLFDAYIQFFYKQ